MVNDVRYEAPLGKSDHVVLTFNFECYTESDTKSDYRFLYHKGNYTDMREDLDIDWAAQFEGHHDDPDKLYAIFTSCILTAQDKHVPKFDRAVNNKRKLPVPPETRSAIRKKRHAWQRYREDRTPERLQVFHRLRNKVRKLIRAAKRDFEHTLARNVKTNPKQFWRYAKSKLKTKPGISEHKSEVLDDAGRPVMTKTDEEKAQVLADWFSKLFIDEPEG